MPLGMALFGLVQTIGTSRNFIRTHHRSMSLAADNEKLKALVSARVRATSNVITGNIEAKINAAIDYLRENYAPRAPGPTLYTSQRIH